MVRNYIKPVVSVMEMEPPWADYPLLLYRPPGITFDVWGQNKKPRSYYASGAVSLLFFFLPFAVSFSSSAFCSVCPVSVS